MAFFFGRSLDGTDKIISGFVLFDELRDHFRGVLQVGGDLDDHISRGGAEGIHAGIDGTEIIGIEDHFEIFILRGKSPQFSAGIISGTVVRHDKFIIILRKLFQFRQTAVIQFTDIQLLVVAAAANGDFFTRFHKNPILLSFQIKEYQEKIFPRAS